MVPEVTFEYSYQKGGELTDINSIRVSIKIEHLKLATIPNTRSIWNDFNLFVEAAFENGLLWKFEAL